LAAAAHPHAGVAAAALYSAATARPHAKVAAAALYLAAAACPHAGVAVAAFTFLRGCRSSPLTPGWRRLSSRLLLLAPTLG
jgi:hypothetical protein